MSRPQIARRRPAPAADVTDVPADTREEDAPVDSLQAMLAELGGATSAAITVYRAERGQKQQYVYKCSPDEFSLDVLRDKYNGGNFRLYISKNGVLYKNVEVAVEPRHATSEAAPSDAVALAAAMREGFERQSAALAAALRTLAAPPPPSPFAGINIPEAITAFSALLGVLRPPPVPAPPPPDPSAHINMLLQGIELAKELKGDSEGEPSVMGLLRDLIKSPLAAQAIAATAAAQPAPVSHGQLPKPAGQRPQPGPQPTVPPIATPSTAQPTQPQGPNMLAHYLGILCTKAAEGSDATLYADLVLDSVPEDQLRAIMYGHGHASTIDALIAMRPDVAAHREWFQGLIDTIDGVLQAPDDLDPGTPDVGQYGDAAVNPTAPSVPGGTPAG